MRDTMHLTAAQDGIYLRLLIHYWHSQRPLPADDRKLAGIARVTTDEERSALATVLAEFFPNDQGVRRNRRMDHEISKWGQIKEEAAEHGRKGAIAMWKSKGVQARARGSHGDPMGVPVPEHDPPPPPPLKEESKSKAKPSAAASPLPAGLDREVFEAWWKTRPARAKTPETRDFIIRQLIKFQDEGHNLTEIVSTSIANGWQGLFRPDNRRGRGVDVAAHNDAAGQEFLRRRGHEQG